MIIELISHSRSVIVINAKAGPIIESACINFRTIIDLIWYRVIRRLANIDAIIDETPVLEVANALNIPFLTIGTPKMV